MAGLRGRVFGGYELVEQLPSGGIADVYRGRPTKVGGRDVVVKVIYPEFAHQLGFIPHFREIVATSSKLASHPHVLPLLTSGEDSGYLYLVTPYVEAGTLRDWLRKGNRMGAGDAAPFFRQMCDALGYAHSLSIVHGNLKPSNIFLFEGRHVLVGDFGLLWDVSHMDMNHAGSGTEAVEFLAPEALSGHITQHSDIYSLGALLFAALVGHAPFHGAKLADIVAAAAHQPIPRLTQANPALPPATQAFDAVIQKAMARRPEDRFPSAAAVAQAIETAAQQAQSAAPVFAAGAAPFTPMSGPMPIGTSPVPPMPPQSGPVGMPGVPGQMPLSGAIAPGGGAPFGAPALSLAQAAAAMGGTAASLGQLNPPFPPLPPTARPDAQMEQARPGGVGGATDMRAAVQAPPPNPPGGYPFSESTIHVPAPPPANIPPQPAMQVPSPNVMDIPRQPTMQVPAPPMPGSAALGRSAGLNADQPWGDTGNVPPLDLGAPPAGRPMRLSGAPRAKLGTRADAPFPTLDDEEDFGPPALPVVRPPAGQSGFAVAGGTGSFDPGARGLSPTRNDAFSPEDLPDGAALDARMPGAGSFGGYDDPDVAHEPRDFAGSSMLNGFGTEHAGYSDSAGQRWSMEPPPTGEYEAHGGWSNGFDGEQERYGNQPAGWQGAPSWGEYTGQHIAGYGNDYTGEQSTPRYSGGLDGGHRQGGGAEELPFSATQLGLPRLTSPVMMEQPPSWQEILGDSGRPPGSALMSGEIAPVGVEERAPTWEDAGESMWQPAVQSPAPRIPQHVEAEWMGAAGAWGTSAPPAIPADNKKRGRRSRADEEDDSGFDDDRVWTVGTTAVRPRRRWPRKLMFLLLVVLLFDMGALVVLRPDLCPTSGCRDLSATLRQRFGLTQSAPSPFVAKPNPVTLTVQSGKSGTANVTVKNATGSNISWKASADLAWLTLDPASGSLSVSGVTTITLTAKPPPSVKAGTYQTKMTITLTDATAQTLTIPVTVTVSAGS